MPADERRWHRCLLPPMGHALTHTRTTDVGSERRRLYALSPQRRSIHRVQMSQFLLMSLVASAPRPVTVLFTCKSGGISYKRLRRRHASWHTLLDSFYFCFADCISISSWPAAVARSRKLLHDSCTLLDAAESQGLSVHLRWLAHWPRQCAHDEAPFACVNRRGGRFHSESGRARLRCTAALPRPHLYS